MKSQITMKDLARHFGVSLSTVHKAISGKPGVSEDTRSKIVEYAQSNGYKHNAMAACLKRKAVNIAVCLPAHDKSGKYFYDYIWQGYRKYLKEWEDLNIGVLEVPFAKGKYSEVLQRLLQNQGEGIDGLLTIPPEDEAGIECIKQFTDRGITVMFVTGDNSECNRLGAVTGDYYAAGRIMAEQTCNLLQKPGHILLFTGDEYRDSHYLISKGFHEYMRQGKTGHTVENLYGYYETELSEERILQAIQSARPDALGCVFARGSAFLASALERNHLAGKIPAIANDVFDENVAALKKGTFVNLVFKDPLRQAYLATKTLCEYLVKGVPPKQAVRKVEIDLIFKSNVNYYWKNKQSRDVRYGEGEAFSAERSHGGGMIFPL